MSFMAVFMSMDSKRDAREGALSRAWARGEGLKARLRSGLRVKDALRVERVLNMVNLSDKTTPDSWQEKWCNQARDLLVRVF